MLEIFEFARRRASGGARRRVFDVARLGSADQRHGGYEIEGYAGGDELIRRSHATIIEDRWQGLSIEHRPIPPSRTAGSRFALWLAVSFCIARCPTLYNGVSI